jgi:hypothetical protein
MSYNKSALKSTYQCRFQSLNHGRELLAALGLITLISGITEYLVNCSNLVIMVLWIVEETHTPQEPDCNRRN